MEQDPRQSPTPRGRRAFLRSLAGGAVAAAAWPGRLDGMARRFALEEPQDEESFWRLVRTEFLIPDDRLFMNVGTLGPQPRPVVDAVIETTRRTAMTYPPGVDWDTLEGALGGLLQADPAGLVFPRNTTEGMSFVANGLELHAGDEILTTDQEHIGGRSCWELAAARHNLRLRKLPLPVPPRDPAELVKLFADAITPATRVISVAHVTFTNGTLLPVADLVRLARSHGIISVIDGAHPPGLMPVDLGAIDPDFYASSPHKWLLAPQGTGFLYIRENWRRKLWVTLASGGWDDLDLGAQRFNHLGTFDESRMAGLLAALRFHQAVGAERAVARARTLRLRLYDALARTPGVHLKSARDEPLVSGMVSFQVDGIDALELQRRLARRPEKVRTRVIGEFDLGWMRLSPHIYNSPEEVDRIVELIADEARRA